MHQLAIALHKKGYQVTGSDDEVFEPSKSNLAAHGLLPQEEGWYPDKLNKSIDAVLLGMHAHADNPELAKAKALGLPIYSFPEYVYRESISKIRVVVGGSHGKTTTTAMMMHVLKKAGLAFDFLVGAKLQGFEQSVDLTDAPILVAEGDEYPASTVERRPKFHFLFPHIAIITGIAWDHINVFPTWENYLEQFSIFIDKIEKGGALIYNETDDVLRELVLYHHRKDLTLLPYGPLPATKQGEAIMVNVEGVSTNIQVFGEHNLLNMHAAWLACKQLGVSANTFADAISSFSGAAKRLEKAKLNNGVIVFRDFAHAPSKVKATLKAMVEQAKPRPVIAVLELHTYSSLSKHFLPHYAHALDGAAHACVFYSNHAISIKRLEPIDEKDIVDGFARTDLFVCCSRPDLEKWLQQFDFRVNQLLLMSSGTYDGIDIASVIGN